MIILNRKKESQQGLAAVLRAAHSRGSGARTERSRSCAGERKRIEKKERGRGKIVNEIGFCACWAKRKGFYGTNTMVCSPSTDDGRICRNRRPKVVTATGSAETEDA